MSGEDDLSLCDGEQPLRERLAETIDACDELEARVCQLEFRLREMLHGPVVLHAERIPAYATLRGAFYDQEMTHLERADGAPAWRMPLTDRVNGLCLHYWQRPSGEPELVELAGWQHLPRGPVD